MPEDKIKYFAYGSNLNIDQMKVRGANIYSMDKAKLPGWKLAFTFKSSNRGGGVLDIIPGDVDDLVKGVVYTIDFESLEKLDEFEGREIQDNREVGIYRRQYIPVILGNNCKTVLTYVVNRILEYKKKTHFPPSEEYIETVINGAESHDLDVDYIDKLKKFQDPEK